MAVGPWVVAVHVLIVALVCAAGCKKSGGSHSLIQEIPQEPPVRVKEIRVPGSESTTVTDINDKGQVVGYYAIGLGVQNLFLWEDGNITELGSLGGVSNQRSGNSANGINNAGQVTGTSTTADGKAHAYRWERGTMTDLGTLEGGSFSIASAIGEDGRVVGFSDIANGHWHPFLWDGHGMIDLGSHGGGDTNYALDINVHGQVVVRSVNTDPIRSFVWESGMKTDLGLPPGLSEEDSVYADAINDLGYVAGFLFFKANASSKGFIWHEGVFTVLDFADRGYIAIYDLNNRLQIVGAVAPVPNYPDGNLLRAVLWENGIGTDLNAPDLGSRVAIAFAINDVGQIVGTTPSPSGYPSGWIMDPPTE